MSDENVYQSRKKQIEAYRDTIKGLHAMIDAASMYIGLLVEKQLGGNGELTIDKAELTRIHKDKEVIWNESKDNKQVIITVNDKKREG